MTKPHIDEPKAIYEDLTIHGEAVVFIGGEAPMIKESIENMNERMKKFAEKFVEQNKDLLKRMADR